MIDGAIADHRARLLLRLLPDAVIREEGQTYRVRQQTQAAIAAWIQRTAEDPKSTTEEGESKQ